MQICFFSLADSYWASGGGVIRKYEQSRGHRCYSLIRLRVILVAREVLLDAADGCRDSPYLIPIETHPVRGRAGGVRRDRQGLGMRRESVRGGRHEMRRVREAVSAIQGWLSPRVAPLVVEQLGPGESSEALRGAASESIALPVPSFPSWSSVNPLRSSC